MALVNGRGGGTAPCPATSRSSRLGLSPWVIIVPFCSPTACGQTPEIPIVHKALRTIGLLALACSVGFHRGVPASTVLSRRWHRHPPFRWCSPQKRRAATV